jgi:hypothetical protein
LDEVDRQRGIERLGEKRILDRVSGPGDDLRHFRFYPEADVLEDEVDL